MEKSKSKTKARVACLVVGPVKESGSLKLTLKSKENLLGTEDQRYLLYLFHQTCTMPSKYDIALGQNKELGFMNRSAITVELPQAQSRNRELKDFTSINHSINKSQVQTTEHSRNNSQSSDMLTSSTF